MNSPINEDAQGLGLGGSQNVFPIGSPIKLSQPSSAFKSEDWRNVAACFPNRDKCEEWHADYLGVMATEELPAGTRVWVNVRQKTDKKGRPFLSVSLRPWRGKGKS